MSERDDVQRWRDPGWWRGWSRLTVSEQALVEPLRLQPDVPSRALSELRREGWVQLARDGFPGDGAEGEVVDDLVERLREGIVALRERKLPAVFVWVFDETWQLFGRLDSVWREVLGSSYRCLPCFWGWYIPVGSGHAGWPAHRDRSKGPPHGSSGGCPSTLTAWVSLGRATPANGCLYVVPAPFTPRNRAGLRPEQARALSAEPGDVFAWRQDIWHWGGQSSPGAPEPRISVALELQSGPDVRYHGPLLEPLRPPPLDHRLVLIGANIGRYGNFVRNEKLPPLGRELVRIAPDLLEEIEYA